MRRETLFCLKDGTCHRFKDADIKFSNDIFIVTEEKQNRMYGYPLRSILYYRIENVKEEKE